MPRTLGSINFVLGFGAFPGDRCCNRNKAGTWMAQKGAPLWEIAGYLGHSDARTAELYNHHPDHLQRAREAFE